MKLHRSFSELVTIARSSKALTLIFGPYVDSIVATSLLLRLFKDEEIDIQLAPFYEASKPIDNRSPLLLVGVTQRSVVSGYRVLQLDDFVGRDPRSSLSLALYTLKNLKDIWIVPQELEVLVLAALVSRTYGSIYDESLLQAHEELLKEAVSRSVYEVVDTLRLFGYPHVSLREALERTLEPYIQGVSLSVDGSSKFLERLGISGDVMRSEDRERLISELEAILAGYARSRVELYGPKIVLRTTTLVDDVYELLYTLYTAIDIGSVAELLIVGIEPQLLEVFRARYLAARNSIRDVVDRVIASEIATRRIVIRGIYMTLVELEEEPKRIPLFTVFRILRGLGIAENMVVYRYSEGYAVPLQLLEPRWPLDYELNVVGGVALFRSLEELSKVL